MTINPNPTPSGYPLLATDNDELATMQHRITAAEDTLNAIKSLIEKLQAQLDNLKGLG